MDERLYWLFTEEVGHEPPRRQLVLSGGVKPGQEEGTLQGLLEPAWQSVLRPPSAFGEAASLYLLWRSLGLVIAAGFPGLVECAEGEASTPTGEEDARAHVVRMLAEKTRRGETRRRTE